MAKGYRGKTLRVNLSDRSISIEEQSEAFQRQYLGGMGVVGYRLLSELKQGTDPLGPDNKLVFAAGPITGVPVAGNGRNSVGGKSPLTFGFGKSEVGGWWGAELKLAGFDSVIVEGRSETPVYLSIRDGDVAVRDARHLWGLETRESQAAIREEMGDRLARVAQIGPAGEKMVRFACIINDLKASAGRTGMGAVMGSKNLKAIAVRGHGTVEVAHSDRIRDMARWLASNFRTAARGLHEYGTGAAMVAFDAAGNIPVNNFQDCQFADIDMLTPDTMKRTIRVGMDGCYACPIRCKKVVKVDGEYKADPEYGGPEYETLAAFGNNCGVNDLAAVAQANHICQAYSMDTISTGVVVSFAMECFESGLLKRSDLGGLEPRFGDARAMVQLVQMIAERRGIGDLLAEGTRLAARNIGGGAEHLAVQVKGVEIGMHEPRLKQGLGLGYAVGPIGGDHGVGIQDTAFEQDNAAVQELASLGFYGPVPARELSPRKATLFAYLHLWRNFQDSLVVCYFVPYSFAQTLEILSATTGWNISLFEAMKMGERAANLARLFNLREGMTAADDALPEKFHSPFKSGPLEGVAIDKGDLETARRHFYGLMGWDEVTGAPGEAKLRELGLDWTLKKAGWVQQG